MPTLTVHETLWQELESAARRRRLSAQKFALEALRDSLRRASDEDLLAQSNRAARGARFRADEAEAIVRRHRQQKSASSRR